MKRIYLTLSLLIFIGFQSLGQTTLQEDANGVLNTGKVVAQTSVGQTFFVGHQLGTSYSYPSSGIFRAWTDNPNGVANYFYDGLLNGTTTYSVRADGQGYFAGNVGIGTSNPLAKLHILGTMLTSGSAANLDPSQSGMTLSYLASSAAMLIGWNRAAGAGETDFIANQGAGSVGGFAFYNHDNNNKESQLMWILGNGQVLIGNTQGKQGNYLLAVAGSAVATSFTVKTVANWPDYVFKKDYNLPSLIDVKTYIDQNQHLPDVPSATDVERDGLNLGEMNKVLVKKVEELTLYLIEKDKKEKEQERRINKLEQQMQQLTQPAHQ